MAKKHFRHTRLSCLLEALFFADMFYGKKKDTGADNSNIVTLQTNSLEAFGILLRYIYDYIPELETPKQAYDVYKIAQEFQVTSLMDVCSEFLSRLEVSPSNVFSLFEVSEHMKNKSLKDRCLKMIECRTREVTESYQLIELTPSMIYIFLDSRELSLKSEYELLCWVISWATEKWRKNPDDYKNPREVLEKLLPDMHFLSLTNKEFAMLYRDHQDFFTQDEVVSIFMNIAIPGSWQMPDWYDKDSPSRKYTE